MSVPTIFMAGGGTGGHVFPLVAVAHAMKRVVPEVRPVFVGTERGMETRFVPEQGFELELLNVLPMRGAGMSGLVRGALRAGALLPESRDLIEKYRPAGIFSVGGYAAGPVTLAAKLMGLPVGLLEPNSVAGLANLLIAPFVNRAYTAFELVERHFTPASVRPLGVPLRGGFEPAPYQRAGVPQVLVLGGSQGAKSLNEVLPVALSRSKVPVRVLHQCGGAHVEAVQGLYRKLGADFVTVTPFIDDMPSALARADLIVSRSGASAVSEIAAVGRPSLLIPYPYASGDHQRLNAEALEKEGAAVCVVNDEATTDRVEAELTALLSDPDKLVRMANAARRMGRPRAAELIARDFLDLVGIASARRNAPPTGGDQAMYKAYGEVA